MIVHLNNKFNFLSTASVLIIIVSWWTASSSRGGCSGNWSTRYYNWLSSICSRALRRDLLNLLDRYVLLIVVHYYTSFESFLSLRVMIHFWLLNHRCLSYLLLNMLNRRRCLLLDVHCLFTISCSLNLLVLLQKHLLLVKVIGYLVTIFSCTQLWSSLLFRYLIWLSLSSILSNIII